MNQEPSTAAELIAKWDLQHPRIVWVTAYAQSWLPRNQPRLGWVDQMIGCRVLVRHEDGTAAWYDPAIDRVEDDPNEKLTDSPGKDSQQHEKHRD